MRKRFGKRIREKISGRFGFFEQYPDKKAKWVIFLANDREYKIECSTTEALYNEYEEIFDHVINSFIMMPEADMK